MDVRVGVEEIPKQGTKRDFSFHMHRRQHSEENDVVVHVHSEPVEVTG
jgi:hypothetical protein